VLRAAGIEPVVEVSGVDEDAVAAALSDPSPADLVAALATAKVDAVLPTIADAYPDAVVIGCDSMLSMTGPNGPEVVGKPHTEDVARQRWSAMAGSTAELVTGHAVVRLVAGAPDRRAAGVQGTTVRFSSPTEAELTAYLASGEPLSVAGGFTLDGLGGWFVEGVDGDPSSVIGISLPLTRRLLAEVGIGVVDLWTKQAEQDQQG
jgi:septum formation protein